MNSVTYIMHFNIQPSKRVTFCGKSCHGGTKLKQQVTVLLVCNDNGSVKLHQIYLETLY